jgi:ferredoxin-nitrite reductase
VLDVGHMTSDQMRALAAIARDCGDGDIRLTVWQNFLFSGVPDAKLAEVEARVAALGLSIRANPIRAGLVACTGMTGCKFAAAHTKEAALAIAAHVEQRVAMDVPVNIHVTGCHNSCAQHYIGDIGLIGAKVPLGDDETVEGFDIVIGGGFADDPKIGRELFLGIKSEDAPDYVERILAAYLAHRAGPEEGVAAWTRRYDAEALKELVETTPSHGPHLLEAAE